MAHKPLYCGNLRGLLLQSTHVASILLATNFRTRTAYYLRIYQVILTINERLHSSYILLYCGIDSWWIKNILLQIMWRESIYKILVTFYD